MVSSRDDLWTKPQKPRPKKTKIYRKSIELLKSSAKVQQKFDIHKDFEIKIEFTCIFIAKYLGMSTNVRPYFRGGTACRVGALEVHKLKNF